MVFRSQQPFASPEPAAHTVQQEPCVQSSVSLVFFDTSYGSADSLSVNIYREYISLNTHISPSQTITTFCLSGAKSDLSAYFYHHPHAIRGGFSKVIRVGPVVPDTQSPSSQRRASMRRHKRRQGNRNAGR